jgi:hypothetical protein
MPNFIGLWFVSIHVPISGATKGGNSMTKKEFLEKTLAEQFDYVYKLGIESTYSLGKGIARDKEFEKIKAWVQLED